MPAGILVRNNNGSVVIDGTFKNLVFASKGVATTLTAVDQFSVVTVNLGNLTGYPLVAVQSSVGAWATVRSYANGNAAVDIVALGPVGTVVNYFVFALPSTTTDAGGFQVFNAAGELVFSAGHRYMRVVGSLSAHAGPGSAPASVTMPVGRAYAVFQTTPMAYAKNVNQSSTPAEQDWYLYPMRGCFSVNGATIAKVWNEFQVTHYGASRPPDYDQAATGFILDITNY